jgi:hypothetical protein
MNWRVQACFIAIVLGVFAYSAFANIEREEQPKSERIRG